MGDKRIKKLKKQMPISDGLRAQAYFRDMAAEGKILDEIGYVYYYFREEEPKDIRYATKAFAEYPSREELAGYAEKGWKEVGHWDTQFVFATEDPNAEELFDHRETERQEVERQLMEAEKGGHIPNYPVIFAIVLTIGLSVYMKGLSVETAAYIWKEYWYWFVFPLIGIAFDFFHKKRLRKKKEELEEQRQLQEEDRWDDSDADWHGKRVKNTVRISILVLLLAVAGYYGCNINEEAFDMPAEVSYADLPVVRVEELQEGDWKRAGIPVDLSREGFGIRNGTDFQGDREYKDAKFWSRVQNYGVEYKYLPVTERKLYMTQYMEDQQTGELMGIETMYWNYRMELLAKRKFEKVAEDVEYAPGMYSGAKLDWIDAERELLNIPKGAFDELVVCRITSEKGERLQLLARYDDQLMEMKYKGTAKIEDILKEIHNVFVSQAK
ncbi:DUF2812 domain-containing protein [Anaerotignum sp.]